MYENLSILKQGCSILSENIVQFGMMFLKMFIWCYTLKRKAGPFLRFLIFFHIFVKEPTFDIKRKIFGRCIFASIIQEIAGYKSKNHFFDIKYLYWLFDGYRKNDKTLKKVLFSFQVSFPEDENYVIRHQKLTKY